jgi:hypothetical protein
MYHHIADTCHHELHITVAEEDVKRFEVFCAENDWGCVIADGGAWSRQPAMTQVLTTHWDVGNSDGALSTLQADAESLRRAGFDVRRLKVEVDIAHAPHPETPLEAGYFEFHVPFHAHTTERLSALRGIVEGFRGAQHIGLGDRARWRTGLSTNRSKGNAAPMLVTLRVHEASVPEAQLLKTALLRVSQDAGFQPAKAKFHEEFCWYDNNPQLDEEWLSATY